MPLRSEGPAPYAPPATALQFITTYRDRGLTAPITEDVLVRAGVSEALAPRTHRTLQQLDLLDGDGNPTAELEGLRRASSDEFKPRLEAVVRAVYAEVFKFVDPAKDEIGRVHDAFRAYEPPGQRARMVTLFMGLCVAAGIVSESKAKSPSTPTTPRTARSSRPPRRDGWVEANKTRGASFAGPAGTRISGGQMYTPDGDIPSGLVAILAMLPKNGAGWTRARRDQFIQLFGNALDFAIPVRDKEPAGPTDSDQDLD